MSVSVTVQPTPALGGRDCVLRFTASSGNFVRVWCTDAPDGSRFRTDLDKLGTTTLALGAVGVGEAFRFTPDVGGRYVLRLDEIKRGAARYSGGYKGDPNAAPSEDLLGSTEYSLSVATRLTWPLGRAPDTASLLVFVSGADVVSTVADVHGIVSPSVSGARTAAATAAANTSALRTAATALSTMSAATALGDLSATITNWIDQFNAHRTRSSVHATSDTANVIKPDYRAPSTPEAFKQSLSAMRTAFMSHLRNDNPTSPTPGVGVGSWHRSGGANLVDWASTPIVNGAGSTIECWLLMADLWRCFESHRIATPAHQSIDSWSALMDLAPLGNIQRLFLAELAALSPTTPANEHSAVTALVNGAGFAKG